jgi:formyltetrahydrofolate synthetase
MRAKLGRIIVAQTYEGKPVTAEDLRAAGAMTVLLKDALKPNLIQTLEHNPCLMHAGPFANIAHGNNSIVADQVALKCGDYVVTESGCGADMGAEKMMDIKCRYSGFSPDCVVITSTIRALKMHGGAFEARPGKPLDEELVKKENMPALEEGTGNLVKQIENMKLFGVPVVVTINQRTTDTEAEIALVKKLADAAGVAACVPIDVWAKGGEGGKEAAQAIVDACEQPKNFKFLYELDAPIKAKIEAIATKIYGADGVDYAPLAEQKIKTFTEQGLDKLPICMAKTHLSLSHDPNLKGVPKNYRLPVRDIKPSVGAGFLYPLCGEMRTMPGLPSVPAAVNVDIDENGRTMGLF